MSTSSASDSSTLPPNPILNPPPFIYKIVNQADWKETYEKNGKYTGSELDQKDGFIHVSNKEATKRTVELYYAGQKNILLIKLIVAELLPSGKLVWDWVPSRQTYFPHYYDLVEGFKANHIKSITPIEYDEEKKAHLLPELE